MGRRSLGRLLLTAFMLLAFALQSYAIQTHIHERLNLSGIAKVSVAALSGHAKKGNFPIDSNPDNCPLCQHQYTGQYVAPNALIFFLPMVAVSVFEAVQGMTPHYDAVSHSWRGRAPPRH